MSQPEPKEQLNKYIKFGSAGAQMGVTILIMAYLGNLFDNYLKTDKPYFTLFFLLIGTIASIYLLIKQVNATK
ncbi:MAG: AtpZ/AtpI family protein [Bacteroidota bacterium]|nr:AtpZ/AtpI family protein [Bacteroidota bacterium]